MSCFLLHPNAFSDLCVFSMNVAAGPELVAAVTNAGGLGVMGGLGYTPKMLREQVCPDSVISIVFLRLTGKFFFPPT